MRRYTLVKVFGQRLFGAPEEPGIARVKPGLTIAKRINKNANHAYVDVFTDDVDDRKMPNSR